MGGLKQIINVMGGVIVIFKLIFKYGNVNVKKGVKIKFNGVVVFDYLWMCYDDFQGDYGC